MATAGGTIPYFAVNEMGNSTVLAIVANTTNLLYNQVTWNNSFSPPVDTGMSVSNVSLDTGVFTAGNAVPTAGSITFFFFDNAAAAWGIIPPVPSYTTVAGSPGNGLDANGVLQPGGTYTVLISQLLAAANISSPFEGHVIAVTNFTHGHGLYVLGNFSGFTQGGTANVIPNTVLVSRAAVIGGADGGEILGQ